MSNHQGWAPKPSSFRAQPVDKEPTEHHVALRGATSAFTPRASAPSIVASSTTVNARRAAYAAGTHGQRREHSKSPERKERFKAPSPPRGRRSYSNNDSSIVTTVSTDQTAKASLPVYHSTLQPQKPLSSTLAARLASERSRSRAGSPTREPHIVETTAGFGKKDEQRSQSPDALAGATASMATQVITETAQAVPTQLVAKRILNFEKIPVLAQPRVQHATDLSSGRKRSVNKTYRDRDLLPDSQRRPSDTNPRSPGRISRESSELQVPLYLSPQPSGQSVSLSVNSTGTSYDKSREVPYRGQSPASRRGSDFKASSMNNPAKSKASNQHNFRDAMTVNALADAMVASSIASSRAGSPSNKPAPPPPRRRSRSLAALPDPVGISQNLSTKPSKKPPRPMKHTLRKQVQSDDEEVTLAKRGRRHWMRKHPNVHSEGDRKRWRDNVTERERKRYEGVFAANRGLLIGQGFFEPSASALADNSVVGNNVVNVVVRDIWERSRLPRDVLKEVYDLVAPNEAYALNREQFVVGLWLIDQRLKGRKLPVKVSTSVWSSVRHSQGLTIRGKRM